MWIRENNRRKTENSIFQQFIANHMKSERRRSETPIWNGVIERNINTSCGMATKNQKTVNREREGDG